MATVADLRRMVREAPLAEPLRLIGDGGLVVLAPHPDDETIGASSLITTAADAGRTVGLVALTDGEGSHRHSQTYPPERLAAVRRDEQAAAMTTLCARAAFETLRLGLPDGASEHDPRYRESAARIAKFCDATGATALAATLPDDPHPDHRAAGLLARAVRALRPRLRVLFYPVWLDRLDDTAAVDASGLTAFTAMVDSARKAAALECHVSQLGRLAIDDPSGFTLPDWFLARQKAPTETFFWSAMPGALPGADHFASLYAGDGDPWHVRSSAYEAGKRSRTTALIENLRYRSGLEIGCGEGHLTALLAGQCDTMLGIDLDPTIVARASDRFGSRENIAFRQGRMPDEFPVGRFDLMVFSEVLYFLREEELRQLAKAVNHAALPEARILLVDYLGATDTPLSGTDAADVFVSLLGSGWRCETANPTGEFRTDRVTRIADGRAAQEEAEAFASSH